MLSWNFSKSCCDEFYETYRSGRAGEHFYKCVSLLSCLVAAVCIRGCVAGRFSSADVFSTADADTDVFVWKLPIAAILG